MKEGKNPEKLQKDKVVTKQLANNKEYIAYKLVCDSIFDNEEGGPIVFEKGKLLSEVFNNDNILKIIAPYMGADENEELTWDIVINEDGFVRVYIKIYNLNIEETYNYTFEFVQMGEPFLIY